MSTAGGLWAGRARRWVSLGLWCLSKICPTFNKKFDTQITKLHKKFHTQNQNIWQLSWDCYFTKLSRGWAAAALFSVPPLLPHVACLTLAGVWGCNSGIKHIKYWNGWTDITYRRCTVRGGDSIWSEQPHSRTGILTFWCLLQTLSHLLLSPAGHCIIVRLRGSCLYDAVRRASLLPPSDQVTGPRKQAPQAYPWGGAAPSPSAYSASTESSWEDGNFPVFHSGVTQKEEALWWLYLKSAFSTKLQIYLVDASILHSYLNQTFSDSIICNLSLPSSQNKICSVSSISFLHPLNHLSQKPRTHPRLLSLLTTYFPTSK